MNAETPGHQDKFRRYRARKKAAGLKEVRLWLPDTKSAEFKAQMERFAEYQRTSVEEREAMEFIEGHMAEVLKNIPPY